MSSALAFEFASPPIWEVGLAVMTKGSPVYDAYDVRSLHDLFRERLPLNERQLPFSGFAPFPAPGQVVGVQIPSIEFAKLDSARWWFVGEEGHDLIQVQENFIARNWRRLEPAPTPPKSYPGFDALLEDFQGQIEKVANWNRERDRAFPEPFICDLLYDNLIPHDEPDGTRLRFSEIFPSLKLEPSILATGLQLQWFEHVDGVKSAAPDMLVVVASVGTPQSAVGAASAAYVKLTFNARSTVTSWSEAWGFFDLAHKHMRKRLLELTSDRCRATWGGQNDS